MDTDEEQEPKKWISYNGLGRLPKVWGVPYMAGLFIIVASLIPAMMLGTFVHDFGWLFALIAIPLIVFAKTMCATDDKALVILGKEVKWALIKKVSGTAKFYGGTLTIAPTSYGRKRINVERNFKAALRG